MIDYKTDYCKIITTDAATKKASFDAIAWMGIQAATRLVDEPILEVRKYESGTPGMQDCAVVMCSRRVLWSIPRKILEPVKTPVHKW